MKNNKKYYKRLIDKWLTDWKEDSSRKPLLLRGARQVGKSSAVHHLSQTFNHFLEVNFEETPSVRRLFQGDLNPSKIISDLELLYNQPIIPGQTLLFFDEIQSCPQAISALRFFYEKMPELHVIAAGSLLEFALQELPSFGVGRIQSLFVYPFSFDEFLLALGENMLLNAKQQADITAPLSEIVHEKLLDLLKRFLVIGGMPQSVVTYVETGNIQACQRVLDDLYLTFRTDFTKYKKRASVAQLVEVFDAIVQQAGGKFVFAKSVPHLNYQQVKSNLDLLIMSGLAIPVTHTAANGLPLGAESDIKKRKIIPFDTGIFQRILGLPLSDFLFNDTQNIVNKGVIAEVFFGLEYLKYSSPVTSNNLYYWQRERAGSNAEVDYIIQEGVSIIPVEIKSSGKGSMQSMRQFMSEKGSNYGYRISIENYARYADIRVLPLYAISQLTG